MFSDPPGIFAALLGPVVAGLIYSTSFKPPSDVRRCFRDGHESRELDSVEYKKRWLLIGPFFRTALRGQAVFRVSVEYTDGSTRSGWARLQQPNKARFFQSGGNMLGQ